MEKMLDLLLEIVSGTFRWSNPVLWALIHLASLLLFSTGRMVIVKIKRKHQNKMFRLALYDIGELAAEEMNCSKFHATKDARSFWVLIFR